MNNSRYIADIEFLCGVGGWCLQSHFIVKPYLVLRLGWGFDNSLDASVRYDLGTVFWKFSPNHLLNISIIDG